jgi:hypothetical protein
MSTLFRGFVAVSKLAPCLVAWFLICGLPVLQAQNQVFYLDATSSTRFHDAHQLSDGTLLLTGQALHFGWLPAATKLRILNADAIDSDSDASGFILHVSADLEQILAAVHFPSGTARSVYRIRSTEVPGQATGDLFISGHRDNGSSNGYFIARLNGNFVDQLPTAMDWVVNVDTRGDSDDGSNSHKGLQPWDVGSDGKVVYALGEAFRSGWAAIQRLDEDGQPEVVEDWRIHWQQAGGEWRGTPASNAPEALSHSAIVMKNRRIGQLRSATAAEYQAIEDDENGHPGRQGRWPDDYYFAGHCQLAQANCDTSQPGYTGYRVGANDTQRVGSIVVDRRSNDFYFGYSTQSRLPGGNPDFEPAVVAMTSTGALKWWARLYQETDQNSSPDQYVDGLAIDYSNDRLIVLARSHGNNVINFWSGNAIALNPGGRGFQNRFTGTNGNIHISWLGRYGLDSGRIHAATWVAEFSEGETGGAPHPDPNLGGWPDPNAGWPNLNTTRCRSDIGVFPDGSVLIACTGRRTATTVNAHQRMPLPGQGVGTWNDFVRVYTPDLSGVSYSSLLTGDWDRTTGQGGGNTHLQAVLPLADGLLTLGHHEADAGIALGEAIPTSPEIPDWGRTSPTGETALIARLRFRLDAIFSDRWMSEAP